MTNLTNFAALTDEQKTVWSMDLWKQARNLSFVNKFLASGSSSTIQHITELTKNEKGARAVITLLADLEGDGVAGDRTLEGNEEQMKSYDLVITLDQLRHANRHEGKMADQRSVVSFRDNSKDVLAYWLADRMDQLAFLTLSGRAYSLKNKLGGTRVGSDLPYLDFAADVSAPSSRRNFIWDKSAGKLVGVAADGNAASGVAMAADDYITWQALVDMKAIAQDEHIRPVRGEGGSETYNVFLSPKAMAKLKMDSTYITAVSRSQAQAAKQFNGQVATVDGLNLYEYRHTYQAANVNAGGGSVEGCQVLFCGAQALGLADIGNPEWNEKEFDFGNQQAVSTGKIFGLRKPVFHSIYSGTSEDFGVMSLYVAQ